MPVSDTQLAWLAGLIDADGCIGIFRSASACGVSYRPTVGFVTTCTKTRNRVDEIVRGIGVVPEWHTRSVRTRPTWSPRWDMQVRGAATKIQPLLEAILPYLVTKREEADCCLEYIRMPRGGKKGRWRPASDRAFELIERVYAAKRSRYVPIDGT